MVSLGAIIFDVDGTLAETEEAHRLAFNEAFASFGFAWRWDLALYRDLLRVSGGKERLTHYLEAYDPPGADRAAGLISAIHAVKTRLYDALLKDGGLQLRPGVAELVTAAKRAGIKLAVATTTNPRNVDSLAQACWNARTIEIFDVIAAGDEVTRKKPAPDVYLLALERLELDPRHCVAIEDSQIGIEAARGAGLAVVATPSIYTDDHEFSGASTVLSDLQGITPEALSALVADQASPRSKQFASRRAKAAGSGIASPSMMRA